MEDLKNSGWPIAETVFLNRIPVFQPFLECFFPLNHTRARVLRSKTDTTYQINVLVVVLRLLKKYLQVYKNAVCTFERGSPTRWYLSTTHTVPSMCKLDTTGNKNNKTRTLKMMLNKQLKLLQSNNHPHCWKDRTRYHCPLPYHCCYLCLKENESANDNRMKFANNS